MVTTAKAAFDLCIPNKHLLVDEKEVQHSSSPHCLHYHLEKEVIINAFQEPPGLPMSHYVIHPADVRVVKVPHEYHDLWTWGCFLSIEDFICLVFLVRWSAADLHYNITFPLILSLSALCQLLIHPQAELHALQLFIDIEDDTPSLSLMTVLPEEPASYLLQHSRDSMRVQGVNQSVPTLSLVLPNSLEAVSQQSAVKPTKSLKGCCCFEKHVSFSPGSVKWSCSQSGHRITRTDCKQRNRNH